MKPVKQYIQKQAESLANKQRDARYIFVLIFAVVTFTLTYLQALSNGLFDSVERPIFHAINNLPQFLSPVFYSFTQLGSIGTLVLWVAAGWYLVNRRAGATVFYAGLLAWIFAKIAKASVHRGRPGALLDNVHLFSAEKFTGFGFPSGHAAFSAAVATVLYYQVAPRYRKYILGVVLMVGLSRMYLGAHFPLDIVGGWALGALVGCVTVLVIGISKPNISAAQLKKHLRRRGYEVKSLHYANVDARGSRPIFITLEGGQNYFGKIFGKHEHAADWLFKIYRFFRYKNLQDEEPYVNSRRNIELEAFATLWARQAGVRTAKVVDTVRIGKLWILLQEQVPNAVQLNEFRHLTQSIMNDAWLQVKLLHDSNMAHRDLRAANLMVDKQKQVWLVDFGFAEVAPNKQRLSMDIAELLMSMSLLAGPKRTVAAALSAFDAKRLEAVLPYLQRSVFSGATAKQLKQNRDALDELKAEVQKNIASNEPVEEAVIVRFNRRKIINIILLAVFLYAIIPQYTKFKGTAETITEINLLWLPIIIVASAATYYLTGLIYVVLADIPLKAVRTTLVQLAASFVSKVVPSGLGSTSFNARYFGKAGMNVEDASAVIVSSTAINFFMFIVPVVIVLLLSGNSIGRLFHFHVPLVAFIILAVVALSAGLVLSFSKKIRHKTTAFVQNFIASLRDISTSPRQLGLAAALSLAVSAAYIVCLYASMRAFGIHLGILSTILVYVTAVIAKSTVPTPGGLGPIEIAMATSLIGFGVDKPIALSIVIVYRLATFWVPIPFSLLAYRYLVKKKFV